MFKPFESLTSRDDFVWPRTADLPYSASSRIDSFKDKLSQPNTIRAAVVALVVIALATAAGSSHGASPAELAASHGEASFVNASASGEDQAGQSYDVFVGEQTALLVQHVTELSDAVNAGDVARAQSAYKEARQPYERIWIVARSFEGLHAEIQGSESVGNDERGGFHTIERALFQTKTAAGLARPVADLLVNVKALQAGYGSAGLSAADLAEGAIKMLYQTAQYNFTGDEDKYAGSDPADAQAALDGARVAFVAVRPMVSDPALVADIDIRFARANDALSSFKKNGTFVDFGSLDRDEITTASASIDDLTKAMLLLPAKLS